MGYAGLYHMYEYSMSGPVTLVDHDGLLCAGASCQPPPGNPISIDASCDWLNLPAMCGNDLVYRAIIDMLRRRCGEHSICPQWTIRCVDQLPGAGETKCSTCEINILAPGGARPDPFHFCGVLIHELVHAADMCDHGLCSTERPGRFGNPDGSVACYTWMCSEMRAAHWQCCYQHRANPRLVKSCKREIWRQYQDPTFNPDCWNKVNWELMLTDSNCDLGACGAEDLQRWVPPRTPVMLPGEPGNEHPGQPRIAGLA